MSQFPVLSRFVRRELLALAVAVAEGLRDGTYWGVETIYDERNFPEPSGAGGGWASGVGD